tara:strand:+ start:114 stop:527 length:414 start_codon:yes stop_codon:yes gene_type:complete
VFRKYKNRKENMKFETNTNSAGAILDYMPTIMRDDMIKDLVIIPEHEDTKHHGGVKFVLHANGKSATWEIIHNFNDYFDIKCVDNNDGRVVQDKDIDANVLITAFTDILDGHFESIVSIVKEELSENDKAFFDEGQL